MKRKPPSILQMRQRELAWALYITEGARANLRHALAVNCVTFEDADNDSVRRAVAELDRAVRHLRKRIATITPKTPTKQPRQRKQPQHLEALTWL